MAATKEKNAHARTMAPAHRSSCATFRNNQAIRPSHNAIVIMQTTQAQNHKQRKRDNANNASVILARRNCKLLRMIVNIRRGCVTIADWHKCRRTIGPTDKPSLWEGEGPIRRAYMISPAYRSARNDKFCLYSTNVLLRMIFIFNKYTCTTSLDTLVAGSDTLVAGSNFS